MIITPWQSWWNCLRLRFVFWFIVFGIADMLVWLACVFVSWTQSTNFKNTDDLSFVVSNDDQIYGIPGLLCKFRRSLNVI